MTAEYLCKIGPADPDRENFGHECQCACTHKPLTGESFGLVLPDCADGCYHYVPDDAQCYRLIGCDGAGGCNMLETCE